MSHPSVCFFFLLLLFFVFASFTDFQALACWICGPSPASITATHTMCWWPSSLTVLVDPKRDLLIKEGTSRRTIKVGHQPSQESGTIFEATFLGQSGHLRTCGHRDIDLCNSVTDGHDGVRSTLWPSRRGGFVAMPGHPSNRTLRSEGQELLASLLLVVMPLLGLGNLALCRTGFDHSFCAC